MTCESETPRLLDDEQKQALAREAPLWRVEEARMTRTFVFPDFPSAVGFLTEVALLAERMGHHPTWTNTYNKVEIVLSTHDAGGLTDRDRKLAAAIDRVFAARAVDGA